MGSSEVPDSFCGWRGGIGYLGKAWTERLGNWRLYAAAAGASLAAASNADATIISGTLSTDLKLPGSPPNYQNATLRSTFTIDGVAITAVLKRGATNTSGVANFAQLVGPVIQATSGSGLFAQA